MGRTEFLTATINSEPRLESANQLLERNGALRRVHAIVCSKPLDTADIVRDDDVTPITEKFSAAELIANALHYSQVFCK